MVIGWPFPETAGGVTARPFRVDAVQQFLDLIRFQVCAAYTCRAIPNTRARAVPRPGSNDPKLVIAVTKVSAVRSATTCGSALRRAK